jgi:hypothetical protein
MAHRDKTKCLNALNEPSVLIDLNNLTG